MQKTDYEFLCSFLIKRSGLSLGEKKEYLLEARLVPLAQTQGLAGIEELVRELRKGTNERLAAAVTEAMTTNETLFFRDKTPFDELREKLLPSLIEARKTTRQLRIWCAAASTGQEPYSFAMLLKDSFPELSSWKIEIIATDICSAALSRAESAVYSQFEIQRGLPIQFLVKYFQQVPNGWKVKDELCRMITFRKQNLLDTYALLGQLDLILVRNVLIYFEVDVKKTILERMASILRPDGYLMLGAAETALGVTDKLTRIRECKTAAYSPIAAAKVRV